VGLFKLRPIQFLGKKFVSIPIRAKNKNGRAYIGGNKGTF